MAQILGIDVGEKTLGLAVSDPGQTVAMPLTTLQRAGMKRDMKRLRELVEERGISEIVLGQPLNLDGTSGKMMGEVERLAAALRDELGATVALWDERLTTAAAERALLEGDVSRRRRKEVIDKVAASLILQGFLDRRLAARVEAQRAENERAGPGQP